jgi:hypothetical protein
MGDKTVPLTMVLAKLKATNPVLFSEFQTALDAFAMPEVRSLLAAPPSHVQLAQGRAQIADELVGIATNCAAKAQQYQQQLQKTPRT